MYVDVSERAFEDATEAGLLQHAQGAFGERRNSYLDLKPGGTFTIETLKKGGIPLKP